MLGNTSMAVNKVSLILSKYYTSLSYFFSYLFLKSSEVILNLNRSFIFRLHMRFLCMYDEG